MVVVSVQAENDVPQPQLFFACGFSNTKPDCISESFQSSVMPCRKQQALRIDYDLDVVELEHLIGRPRLAGRT